MMTNWRLISSSTLGHNKMCSALNILFPTGPDQTITTLSTSRFLLVFLPQTLDLGLDNMVDPPQNLEEALFLLLGLQSSAPWPHFHWALLPCSDGRSRPHTSQPPIPAPPKTEHAREIFPQGSSFVNKAIWSFREGTSGQQQGRVLAGEPNKMQARV